MKRTLVGAGLLVAAGVGTVAMAPGGAAQGVEPEWVELEAHFEPNPAEPGEIVTLTPDEPCSFDVDGEHVSEPGVVAILLGEDEGDVVEVPMDEDGFWSFEIAAPLEPGDYYLEAECRNSTYEEELRFCQADPEDAPVDGVDADGFELVSYSAPTWDYFDCKFEYYSADLTVAGDEVPPTTTTPETPPAETPPPATPVVRPPDQTG